MAADKECYQYCRKRQPSGELNYRQLPSDELVLRGAGDVDRVSVEFFDLLLVECLDVTAP